MKNHPQSIFQYHQQRSKSSQRRYVASTDQKRPPPNIRQAGGDINKPKRTRVKETSSRSRIKSDRPTGLPTQIKRQLSTHDPPE